MERVYSPLPYITEKTQALEIMKTGTDTDLMLLPLSLGMCFPEWKFAQDICIALAKNQNAAIRANAVLGLAYIARTQGVLEKHLVKPVVLKELRENEEFKWRIEDAIVDMNRFMKWNMAHKTLSK